jgi:alpha-amylase/alpha-mannosidase (GH57 family)
MARTIHHALVLNLHQPPGNLNYLWDNEEWEAKEILWALDRIPRMLWNYEDIARVHLTLSGSLLETIASPNFQEKVYGTVKLGDLLWHYQNEKIINILGMGYYHPVLALIPKADREAHLSRWLEIAGHLFHRNNFQGFWPSEMGFCMELIPLIKKMGYQFVMVDSRHIIPKGNLTWQEIRYQPHIAKYGGEEIIVIVRDREVSNAQESGMSFDWFNHELQERTKWCDFEPLVMTATDGDNGGWFRNTDNKGNFWNAFYLPFLEEVKSGHTPIRPCFIHEYIEEHGVGKEVRVAPGAWNTGWHHGSGFVQWTGSKAQVDAIERIQKVSDRYHAIASQISKEMPDRTEDAYWRLLRAQTSCNLFWGEAWLDRCHNDLDDCESILEDLESMTIWSYNTHNRIHNIQ